MKVEPIIAGDFPKKVIPLIESARNNIDVCVFDWRWYPNDPGATCQLFNQAVVRAVRRGVKVRAIVNNSQVATALQSVGVDVKKFTSAHLLHCKLMIFDDDIVVTGSHNYTQSAFTDNYELSVILSDGIESFPYCDFFDRLFGAN